MKITTINVNQFIGIDNWNDYSSREPERKEKKWNEIKSDWKDIIFDKLKGEKDILFLNEVPHKMYPRNPSAKLSNVYLDLVDFCDKNHLNTYMTNNESTIFKSIAISKSIYEYPISSENLKSIFRIEQSYFEDSRIVILKDKNRIIMGIHNPSVIYNSIVFLNNIKEMVNKYFIGNEIICCGDINIYENEVLLNKEKELLKDLNLYDAWIRKGYSNDEENGMTFFRYENNDLKFKNRIDKFFISESISNYEIKVDQSIVKRFLSDHNALSIEV